MITCIIGPMFSRKSAALINDYKSVKQSAILNSKLLTFKPGIDTRENSIKTRDTGEEIPATCIETFEDILKYIDITSNIKYYIFIDEAQFLKGDPRTILELSLMGYEIYIAGLALTSEQKSFGSMPYLFTIADYREIRTAMCEYCDKAGVYTVFRKGKKTKEVLVGSNEYIPLCEECFKKEKL